MNNENFDYNCVIAIDPGASGGIAVYYNDFTSAYKMPKDIGELPAFLEHWREIANPVVFVEKLSVRPDDISVNSGGANMGKLYRIQKMMANYEALKAVITFSHLDMVQVHPLTWQSGLKIRKAGEDKPERKKRYKEIAQVRYPSIKVTMANCDALLILDYARWALVNAPKDIKKRLTRHADGGMFGGNV